MLTSERQGKESVSPKDAMRKNQGGTEEVIVNGEGRVKQRPVKKGQRIGTGIVILEGLVEGQTLIVEGIQKVHAGAEVETVQATPADNPETEQ